MNRVWVLPFSSMSPSVVSQATHIVSIGSNYEPEPFCLKDFEGRKLRLEFDDIETDTAYGGAFAGCTMFDIKHLIRFFQEIPVKDQTILIHCGAGKSRSTAAALIYFAALGVVNPIEAFTEAIKASEVSGQRPLDLRVMPNQRMLDFAEWLLDCDALSEKVKQKFG
jgi:predicted protein tyrosine phosphatase